METQPGSTSMNLDEFETNSAAPVVQDLNTIKFEGDSVPEELRGKTAAEVAQYTKVLKDSFLASEQARKQAELTAQTALQSNAAPPAPVVESELNDEQLLELHNEDPIKALHYMQARAERVVQRNMEARLAPMVNNSATQNEQAARQKYATEFELFGAEISKMMQNIPNAKEVFSNAAAFDELIGFVRGKPGNFERIIEHKSKPSAEAARQNAQREQASGVGFSDNGGSRPAPIANTGQLDSLQMEVARNLRMSPEEYIKWSKV